MDCPPWGILWWATVGSGKALQPFRGDERYIYILFFWPWVDCYSQAYLYLAALAVACYKCLQLVRNGKPGQDFAATENTTEAALWIIRFCRQTLE